MDINIDDIIDAITRDDHSGFCVGCGAEAGPVEPDARRYICESCGQPKVYGAQELLFMSGSPFNIG